MSDLEANSILNKQEKSLVHQSVPISDFGIGDSAAIKPSWSFRLYSTLQKLDHYGVESRGIERVASVERHKATLSTWTGLCLIWTSAGMGLSTFATGLIGPLYYNLTFAQTVGIIFGAGFLGALVSGWLATFGKRNGLRALTNSRYTFGYYGAMFMAFLNVITEGAFGIQMAILGGQALEVVSKGRLPVAGGIPLVVMVSWLIATGGYKFIHYWSRIGFVFPLIVCIAMLAKSSPMFSNAGTATLDAATQNGLTLSYFAIIFGSGSGWAAVSADYYIYLDERTPSWKPFLMSFLGTWLLPTLMYSCGAGYGSILLNNADWAEYYEANGESAPALILYSLESLGNVRYFFVFIMAISTLNNNIFNLYSISISMQLFGKWTTYVPRMIWNLVGAIVVFLIAIIGRDSIYTIIGNSVAVIAYWTAIFFAIILIEDRVFRRRTGYDHSGWNDSGKLPKGYAAMLAFGIGAAGSIIGMGQTWYYGPIARQIGEEGGDVGIELGMLFAIIVYPVLRHLELKKFGR
ncbi:hypothetical protein M438DRAFT_285059 [Aureobasidium pullulans EXF-150]|uniref:Purine-cytosine permease n=1 Tax=Aureobasidium pullulans EXF-150 TaxID=1043002 RepID=A0A074X4P6_AURPU|nr:uncharacterized protein M438DRAFT_285059 [Aureobasidium pullulans EXF-150]KEQ78734.1 hypothetical protein M438DRAFT_285059 [Aureobasidium pullulans EXF-150]